MLREMLKSKLHRAAITAVNLHYKGSIGVDSDLLAACDMLSGERVQVLNFNNGERFETYAIAEAAGSGAVVLYGPAARLGSAGDIVSVLSYCLLENEEARRFKPRLVFVDKGNRAVKAKGSNDAEHPPGD